MIAYQFSLGNSMRLGQVAYAQPYPPSGLEWGQGWGRFAPSTPKVVLPRSPEAGGGVGYTSEGTVLTQQDIEEISATTGGGTAAPAAQPAPSVPAAPSGGKLPLAAAGIAVVAIAASIFA